MKGDRRKYFCILAVAILIPISLSASFFTASAGTTCVDLNVKMVAGCEVEKCILVRNPGLGTCFRVSYQVLPDSEGISITMPEKIYIKSSSTGKLCFTINTSIMLKPGEYHIKITLYRCSDECGVTVQAWHAVSLPKFLKSYFRVKITNTPNLNGVYNGWCVDLDTTMRNGKLYKATAMTSYDLAHPENLDLVNYIINQHFVGKHSKCSGKYTFGDVQRAIWTLIENHQSSSNLLGPWKQCRVNEIISKARTYGEGFTPRNGQFVGVILKPCDLKQAQICIIEVPYGSYNNYIST